jgi:hypothetical protein
MIQRTKVSVNLGSLRSEHFGTKAKVLRALFFGDAKYCSIIATLHVTVVHARCDCHQSACAFEGKTS